MTEQPKPHAFCVTLIFDDGLVLPVPVIAPGAAAATALCAFMAGRDPGVTGTITGIGLLELEADWLRQALRALEGDKPTADVVSLVPKDDERPEKLADEMFAARYTQDVRRAATTLGGGPCRMHPEANVIAGICPVCADRAAEVDRQLAEAHTRMLKPALDHIAGLMPEPDRCPSHTWQPLDNGACPLCRPDTAA